MLTTGDARRILHKRTKDRSSEDGESSQRQGCGGPAPRKKDENLAKQKVMREVLFRWELEN